MGTSLQSPLGVGIVLCICISAQAYWITWIRRPWGVFLHSAQQQ